MDDGVILELLLPFHPSAAIWFVVSQPHQVSNRALLWPLSHLGLGLTFRSLSASHFPQSQLLPGLPCLLPLAETRAPWPWQMCEAGGGTLSPDVIVFMFPESEGWELWTGAAGGGVVWLQPPAPAFPPPTSLLQPVSVPLRIPHSKSYRISLGHPPRRTLPHASSEGEKTRGKMPGFGI